MGPLSSPQVIKILNAHFVNVWMMLKDLREIQSTAKSVSTRDLSTKLSEHYTYPVDSIILSPRLEFVNHQPANELPDDNQYLTLLQRSLVEVHRQ